MIDVEHLGLRGVYLIKPKRFVDPRGYFCESYNRRDFALAGMPMTFVQDNESYSLRAGTVRGIHFQIKPYAQDKLVRVLRGAILDVIVDLRVDSPTFGRHVQVRLDAERGAEVLVPKGFGHAMCTLENHTIVHYKVSQEYSAPHDRGIIWQDPALAIKWPVEPAAAHVSDKDRKLPLLRDVPRAELFTLAGVAAESV